MKGKTLTKNNKRVKKTKKAKREKKIVIKESKPAKKVEIKKKRVNFSWLSNQRATQAKAYIAFLADTRKKARANSKSNKDFFDTHIYERVMKKHGTLYKIVKKYYDERGAELSPKRYKQLLYCRFTNMYEKDGTPSKEHPKNAKSVSLRDAYKAYLKKRKKAS